MNEFVFEQSPWEDFLDGHSGGKVSALQLLTLLEGEDEDTAREALESLDEQGIALDVSDLPAVFTGQAAQRLKQEGQWAVQGLHPRELEAGDPLRLYLEEVAATPAFGDEAVLALEVLDGSETAAAQLTNLGLSRVIQIANAHAGRGVLLLDLIQEGNLGLWTAVSTYSGGDYSRQRDFYIENAMARCIAMQARANGLVQKMRAAMEDYRAVDERLLSDLGRNPTVEEIAQELHMTVSEAESVGKMLDNARLLNIAQPPEEPEEAPEEENLAVEDTAYFQMRSRIMELLSVLDEADSKLLTLRYGLEGGLPKDAAEVGRILGLTASEVTVREGRILARLRTEN